MTEAEMLAALEQIGAALAEKFVKKYSAGRLEAIKGVLSTLAMHVTHIHDEAAREEDQSRKDSAAHALIQAGVAVSEAQSRVESGER